MTTRFSKKKLAKAKGGTVSGLLYKKKASDVKKDPVITPSPTPPPTHLPAKRPTSPTSSLEMIVSSG